MKALKEREVSIHEALTSADKARKEMEKLHFSNEKLLQEAKNERDAILAEARKIRENILEESKVKAGEEANRIVNSAKESIHYEKMAAMTELKDQLASLSLEVAKKILKRELADPGKQEAFVKELMKDFTFN